MNAFLAADDLAGGQLQIVMPRDCAAVEVGSYVFTASNPALERPAVRKLRQWLAVAAKDFLAEHPSMAISSAPEPIAVSCEAA